MKYWIALCILLLFTLVACDTTSIDEPPPGGEEGEEETPASCDGDLLLQSAVPDTSRYANEGEIAFFLDFKQTASEDIAYTVEPTNSQVAQADIVDDSIHMLPRIRLQPLQIGETSVTVTATDACGNTETMQFTFTVLDPCPPLQPEGTFDYFPLEVGQTWTFDHVYQMHAIPSSRVIGTLTWTVAEEPVCSRGTRIYKIIDYFEGTRQWRETSDDAWQESYSFDDQKIRSFVQEEATLSISPYSFQPFQRYWPASAPDTVNISQIDACSSHRPCKNALYMVRNNGLVVRHFIDHPSAGWYETVDQVRIDN